MIWQKFKMFTLNQQLVIIGTIIIPISLAILGGSWKVYTYFAKQSSSPSSPQTTTISPPSNSVQSSGHGISIVAPVNSSPNSTQIIVGGDVNLGDPQDKEIIRVLLAGQQVKNLHAEEQARQIQALKETLQALRAQKDKPNVQDALILLKQGDTKKAEKLFRQVLKQTIAEGSKANKEAAAIARHLGSLAFLHDTKKALQFYIQATDLDPGNPLGWQQRGRVMIKSGV